MYAEEVSQWKTQLPALRQTRIGEQEGSMAKFLNEKHPELFDTEEGSGVLVALYDLDRSLLEGIEKGADFVQIMLP